MLQYILLVLFIVRINYAQAQRVWESIIINNKLQFRSKGNRWKRYTSNVNKKTCTKKSEKEW